MIEKKTILYVEDARAARVVAEMNLRDAFPGYKIFLAESRQNVVFMIESGAVKPEEIALVCTDGRLAEDSRGWEVVQDLRDKGFTGPALYISKTRIPDRGKESLYCEIGVEKVGSGLVKAVGRHLPK